MLAPFPCTPVTLLYQQHACCGEGVRLGRETARLQLKHWGKKKKKQCGLPHPFRCGVLCNSRACFLTSLALCKWHGSSCETLAWFFFSLLFSTSLRFHSQ